MKEQKTFYESPQLSYEEIIEVNIICGSRDTNFGGNEDIDYEDWDY